MTFEKVFSIHSPPLDTLSPIISPGMCMFLVSHKVWTFLGTVKALADKFSSPVPFSEPIKGKERASRIPQVVL